MNKFLLSLTATTVLFFSGCNSTTKGINVESHTAQKVNLDGYKSYEWLASASIIVDENNAYKNHGYNVEEYIQSQISKTLLNKNRTHSSSNPDFLVSYITGVNMDAVKEKVDDAGKKYIDSVPKAALAIVLIDTRTSQIIWSASADAKIQETLDDTKSKERIDYAIEKMFSNF